MHSESADFLGGLRPVRHRGQEEQVRCPAKLGSILMLWAKKGVRLAKLIHANLIIIKCLLQVQLTC